jgi:hypothetical protein
MIQADVISYTAPPTGYQGHADGHEVLQYGSCVSGWLVKRFHWWKYVQREDLIRSQIRSLTAAIFILSLPISASNFVLTEGPGPIIELSRGH